MYNYALPKGSSHCPEFDKLLTMSPNPNPKHKHQIAKPLNTMKISLTMKFYDTLGTPNLFFCAKALPQPDSDITEAKSLPRCQLALIRDRRRICERGTVSTTGTTLILIVTVTSPTLTTLQFQSSGGT